MKSMKKNIMGVLLILVLAITLVGCSEADQIEKNPEHEATHKKVTVVGYGGEILFQEEGPIAFYDMSDSSEKFSFIYKGEVYTYRNCSLEVVESVADKRVAD